jgi:hypothetical protein
MLATNKLGLMEALQVVLDELCSAEVTLGRAEHLRQQVLELVRALEVGDRVEERHTAP